MFIEIPFNQLAHAGYNRGVRRSWVDEIKETWCPAMKQPAIVSFRDGKYWIIDHQHQSQAEYELNGSDPNTMILCDVRYGMTYEQEAELYCRLNTGTKKLSAYDTIKGNIEAKNPEALKYKSIIESHGYVIGGLASNSLCCIDATLKIFSKPDGDKHLAEILSLTSACWPADRKGVKQVMIKGIEYFLKHHNGEFSKARFIKALSSYDPNDIIYKATTFYKNMNSKSFTQPYCTYTVIIDIYNTGLRKKLTQAQPLL